MDFIYRLVIAFVLIALGLVLYQAWNRWQLGRLGRGNVQGLPGLEGWRSGVPAVLYFTTPDCVPCRTAQRPALERLKGELTDGVQVIEVDASAQTVVADHWGVLSVPTTFVLDRAGQPRHVNHGVASAEKLKRQLVDVENNKEEKFRLSQPNYQVK
jgi:thioredoxin 1